MKLIISPGKHLFSTMIPGMSLCSRSTLISVRNQMIFLKLMERQKILQKRKYMLKISSKLSRQGRKLSYFCPR